MGVTHERGALRACPALWELSICLRSHPGALRWGTASELVLWQDGPFQTEMGWPGCFFCFSSISRDSRVPLPPAAKQRSALPCRCCAGAPKDASRTVVKHPCPKAWGTVVRFPPGQVLPACPSRGEKLIPSPSDKRRWGCSCAVPSSGQHLQCGSCKAAWHLVNLEILSGSHVTSASDNNKQLFQIREGGTEKGRDNRVGGG